LNKKENGLFIMQIKDDGKGIGNGKTPAVRVIQYAAKGREAESKPPH